MRPQVLPAGLRDRPLVVERAVPGTPNALNEPQIAWTEIMRTRATREDVSDREQTTAGRSASALTARFVIASGPVALTVTTADRVACDGRIWNIEGVKESRWSARGRPAIEITATARSD